MKNVDDDLKYLLALNQSGVLGPVALHRLKKYFRTFVAAWQASASDYQDAKLAPKQIAALTQTKKQTDPDDLVSQLKRQGIAVLVQSDANYPQLLRGLDDAPYLLYIRGEITPADNIALGIVGTRRPSDYGRQVTENFARHLAQNSVTIVSGLALGVDGLAHRAALACGGRTIAVLAGGLDRIYPAIHAALGREILERQLGALVSEYPPGTPCYQSNFPVRNRIIAGLARSVLITEAALGSGSLHTALAANRYNRDVYVVPQPIYSPAGAGANQLLTNGAIPVTSPEELLKMIGVQSPKNRARKIVKLSVDEQNLFALLGKEPLHVDELVRQINQPVQKIVGVLSLLELKGLTRHVGGMRYIIVG